MKITMSQNSLKEIKLALEVIKKKMNIAPKIKTFEFSFEEFIPEKAQPVIKGVTNFATETEKKNLTYLFKKIEKESKRIIACLDLLCDMPGLALSRQFRNFIPTNNLEISYSR